MGRFGGGDQQFAGHAAHARAGRAVGAAFYHHHALAIEARRPVGRHACRATADHGYIHLYRLHVSAHPAVLICLRASILLFCRK